MTQEFLYSARLPLRAASFAAMLALVAGTSHAANQPQIVTPVAPPVLPNTLYFINYAVSDHSGQAQQAGSGVAVETIVSIGLPDNAAAGTSCRVQLQWMEWDGTVAGYSGPVTVAPGATYEFVTTNAPTVIITPFNQNIFSNITGQRTFEGHARVRTDCASGSRLRVDAKYVTFTPGTPTTSAPVVVGSIKRHEIKVVRTSGNAGD